MRIENQMLGVVPVSTSRSSDRRSARIYRSAFKRPIDMMLVLFSLPFVLPVVVILALLVWRDGGNPFYTQMRIGRNGKHFRMWKLRSMVVNADQRLAAHLEADENARKEWATTQKLRNDPRVTRFGSLLRRSSMDELPQLWNVLKGDMSLVGPRPMMPSQEDMYDCEAYYRLRPGITGFWQTAGRNATSFADRAWYDERYERDLSFTHDAAIIARTLGVVLRGTGC